MFVVCKKIKRMLLSVVDDLKRSECEIVSTRYEVRHYCNIRVSFSGLTFGRRTKKHNYLIYSNLIGYWAKDNDDYET
jgi:hypothetical protein